MKLTFSERVLRKMLEREHYSWSVRELADEMNAPEGAVRRALNRAEAERRVEQHPWPGAWRARV